MTAVELERVARSIVPPVGATMAIARVDEQLKHRAAFLIDGRIRGDYVGPSFDRPHDAIALVRILNGEAPRPDQSDLARLPGTHPDRRDEVGQTEAPAPQDASTSSASSRCVVCLGPLPPGSRRQRRTCSGACRERAAYRRAHGLPLADAEGATGDLTVSEGSDAVEGGRLQPTLGLT